MEEKVNNFLHEPECKQVINKNLLTEIISCIDLTTLNPADNEESVSNLCRKATTDLGNVAAVCVYPEFVPVVVDILGDTDIKIASVANFPTGNQPLDQTFKEIDTALLAGANEMDIVFPHAMYLEGNKKSAFEYIAQCKIACRKAALKIIIEISEFPKLDEIYLICEELISLDVNFLKTSTGKSKHGATLEAAATMLLAIRETPCNAGFKASGGVKTLAQACGYMNLAKKIMTPEWVTPAHFRIGASSLLDELLNISNEISD